MALIHRIKIGIMCKNLYKMHGKDLVHTLQP